MHNDGFKPLERQILTSGSRKLSKNHKKNPPPPPEILKNPQKILPGDIFEGFGYEKCVTKGGPRAQARAPPLWVHLKAKTHKNVSREGFLRVLRAAGKFFEGFSKFPGAAEGFLMVF